MKRGKRSKIEREGFGNRRFLSSKSSKTAAKTIPLLTLSQCNKSSKTPIGIKELLMLMLPQSKSSKTAAKTIILLMLLTLLSFFFLSLAKAPTWVLTNTQADFNNGTYTNTSYYPGGYVGMWEELPDNQADESGSDGANMTGNTLLFHFNNDSAYGENDSITYDFSGNGNNGSMANQPNNATWTSSGKFGGAYIFDGVDDHIEIGDVLDIGINDTSIGLWVKTEQSATNRLVSKQEASGDGYLIMMQSGNLRGGIQVSGTFYDALSTETINDNNWHYILMTIDRSSATGIKLYIDGVEVSYGTQDNPTAVDGTDINTTYHLRIGTRDGAGYFFNGTFDEVAFWNRSLSTAEISAHYNRSVATHGTYESKVYDANSTVSWENLSWTKGGPYQEELPGNQEVETKWLSGNANMTGNVLLMHFNNDSSVGDNTTWTYDYSGNGNNGTFKGAGEPAWNTSGKFGSALSFDGTDDYVSLGTTGALSGLLNGCSAISTSAWIYIDTLDDTEQGIIHIINYEVTNSVYAGFAIAITATTDRIKVGGRTKTTESYESTEWTTAVTTGQWYHVVGILDFGNDKIKIYVNGDEKVSTDVTFDNAVYIDGGGHVSTDKLGMQTYHSDDDFQVPFDGTIDEVAIYNRSLSAAEILEHYKRGVLNLTFQVRSDDDNASWMDYIGPDNTSSSYFTNATLANLSLTNLSNARYFQYKVYFEIKAETTDTSYTPELWNVTGGYELVEPTATLNSPNGTYHNSSTVSFNCSAVGNGNLVNISLYTNTTGTWLLNKTNNVTGTSNSTNFTVSGIPDGSHAWNCLAYNDAPLSAFADSNYTFVVDTTFPQINFTSPTEASGNYVNKNYTYVNVTVSDANNVSSFINWNNSLVGYWNFEEGSGSTATDNSTYGNDGSITSATPTSSGKFGSALTFDGSDDYVDVADNDSLTNQNFTLEYWAKTPDASVNQWAIYKGSSGTNREYASSILLLYEASSINFRIFPDGSTATDSTNYSGVLDDTWYHIVGTYEQGVGAKLYVNGILRDTNDEYTGSLGNYNSNLYIGQYGGGSSRFKGTIDEVRIWNRALSEEEINASYNTGTYRLYHNFTGLADGNYSYYAQSIDLAGNINLTETRTLTTDTTPPHVAFGSGTEANDTAFNRDWIYVNVSVTESNEANITFSLYNTTNEVNSTSYTTAQRTINWSYTSLPETTYYYNVTVYDLAGNSNTSETRQIILDRTNPQINFTDPTKASGDYVKTNYTYVNVTVNDTNNISSFINWNNSLVGYWNFENVVSGAVYDNSTYGNNGTITSATWTTAGKFGGAFEFDGVDDLINVSNSASLDITGEITIEGWVNLDSTDSEIAAKSGTSDYKINYRFKIDSSGYLHFALRDSGGTYRSTTTSTSVGTSSWKHVVVTFDESNAYFYLDGIADSGNPYSLPYSMVTNTHPLDIGAFNDEGTYYYFNGTIDEVRIWNRALSAEEINASYNTGVYRLYHNFTGLADGNYSYYAQTIDLAGNINQTETRTLAIDTATPSITNMSISPSAAADIDPNVNMNVTINVTDAATGIDTIILQYWNYSTSVDTCANVTMSSIEGDLYNASFNASVNGTWYYQVWANDSAGNSINNTPNSTDVQYECTWSISDTISDPTLGAFETTDVIGNITINNTGDANYPIHSCTLSFILTDNLATGRISYSPSDAVIGLAAKDTSTVNITATFLNKVTSESLVITITDYGRKSATYQTTSNATLTSYAGGPYLNVVINSSPSAVNQTDDLNFTLSVYVQNIGNESASNVTLNWTLPTGWGNLSGLLNVNDSTLNCSDPTISPSIGCTTNASLNTLVNLITATVSNPNTASIGTVTIYANTSSESKVNSSCSSNCSYVNASDSATATVSCYAVSDGVCPTSGTCSYDSTANNYDPDCTAPEGETITTGGGGGAGAAPAAIVAEAIYELVRGKDEDFSLEVKNPFKDASLRDIKMKVTGFLAPYITIEPAVLDKIEPNSTFNFTIRITAPAYFTVGKHDLTFTISSTKQVGVTETARTEKRYVTLAIHDVGRGDAAQLVSDSEDAIAEMIQLDLNVKKVQQLLSELQEEFEKSNYENVKELSQKVSTIKQNALQSRDTITSLQEKIKDAEGRGINAEDTKILLNLAIAAFERGDYALALERAKDAEMTYAVETKGEFNLFYFVANNTIECLVGIIILTFLSALLFLKVKLSITNHSLSSLYGEQDILLGLMKTVQHECFIEKKMSMGEYRQSMLEYEDRFSKAVQHALKLESIKANLFKLKKKGLEMERQGILKLMKELQSKYIKEGKVETRVYDQKMQSFTARLSEIEEQIALNEAKRALHRAKRRRFLRRFGLARPKATERLARKKKQTEHKRMKLKEKIKRRFESVIKKATEKKEKELDRKRKEQIERAKEEAPKQRKKEKLREKIRKRFERVVEREEKRRKGQNQGKSEQ